jgi:Zn-finger nucleic acid-binding protein
MSDRQGIEIDYCPECRGVWLDRGELAKIIGRTMGAETHPTRGGASHQDRSRSHGKDEYFQKKKKHKSILGELFDF